MTDRPIIFSASMVNALLAGRKTQTRRVFSPMYGWPAPQNLGALDLNDDLSGKRNDPASWGWPYAEDGVGHVTLEWPEFRRYQVGDRLYVREHWRVGAQLNELAPRDMDPQIVGYEADCGPNEISATGRHRQGMHMPRWASRMTLIVTDVRVERVQDISEEDARAEGVATIHGERSFVWAFSDLWDSLHTAEPKRWRDNPWVVAVSFDVVRENIDRLTPTPQIERRR